MLLCPWYSSTWSPQHLGLTIK
ncbi:rCG49650, partial [Rattus norvegicus]